MMPLVSALAPDELLTEVRLPAQPPGAGSAVLEIARRHGDFAMAGVVASADRRRTTPCATARLVGFATGAGPASGSRRPRARAGRGAGDDAARSRGRAGREPRSSPTDDVHATAEYRRRVTRCW